MKQRVVEYKMHAIQKEAQKTLNDLQSFIKQLVELHQELDTVFQKSVDILITNELTGRRNGKNKSL